MSSIRDWCPACNEMGWACTCRAPAKPAPKSSPSANDREAIERLRVLHDWLEERGLQHFADTAANAADTLARNAEMREALEEAEECIKDGSYYSALKVIRKALNLSKEDDRV